MINLFDPWWRPLTTLLRGYPLVVAVLLTHRHARPDGRVAVVSLLFLTPDYTLLRCLCMTESDLSFLSLL